MVVRTALAQKHIKSIIIRTPGVMGGRPRVDGHRIRVQDVAHWYKLGMSPDEIASELDLTLGQVHGALSYYFDHIAEIRRDLEEDRRIVAASKKRHPSKLQARLKAMRG
jgi:uncharacterized protein (DUF433 family)